MATEREKERESELESAMYTNCLLLGLDPSLLGPSPSSPRVGLFRHSNPKLGEQLLYFLLSALRGPIQSAKDFDKVWPIFDSAQSRDFRKIVQGIISELESQGALPRSNSRVSSLATCCGPRFVELLWQLSVHALREVHRRTFAADVASNPLPASLTDVSYLHAASLLPVTKARIALERRKFLKNAALAVQRQNAWSNLAQEMTAEFRGLCAEEAYLQQELEKLQEMRNKAKLDGELWDDRISSTSGQSSHLVSKATRLWESILARKGQHEVLASGPIEDLIAHREHRYRISGSALRAAMDHSLNSSSSNVLSGRVGETSPVTESPEHSEITSRTDDRGGRVEPVDVAEILRRWTHALQRIHKQSLHLAKANDGEGPELLRSSSDSGGSGHAESLATTLAEHRQHLVSIQGLISQLKESIPAMQRSISELTEEANSVSSSVMDEFTSTSNPIVQSHIVGRQQEAVPDEAAELASRLSSVQLDKVPGSPALKLPPLFSVTPNSSAKNTRTPKRPTMSSQANQETLPVGKSLAQQLQNDEKDALAPETDFYSAQNIRRSVREAVMSRPTSNPESAQNRSYTDESKHYFMPLPSTISYKETDAPNRRKQRLVFSPPEIQVVRNTKNLSSKGADDLKSDPVMPSNFSSDEEHAILHQPAYANGERIFPGIDDSLDQVFSPPLLMESTTFFQDSYEDLLAPLSETDTALMDL